MMIDINCDLGESYGHNKIGNDAEIMKYISSANIACGFHAGDPLIMNETIQLAIENNVAIGAHPGFPDLKGFGRREIKMTHNELHASIIYQVGALKTMTESLGATVQHVKPHGAMYNMAAKDYDFALVIANAISQIDKNLIFVGLANSIMIKAAKEAGLKTSSEVFADRAYTNEGFLVSRNIKGAVIHDETECLSHIHRMIIEQKVKTINNYLLTIKADTICLHGDNQEALRFAKSLRKFFNENNVSVSSMSNFISHV